MFHLFLH